VHFELLSIESERHPMNVSLQRGGITNGRTVKVYSEYAIGLERSHTNCLEKRNKENHKNKKKRELSNTR
jgi:hypothetical protein